MSANQGTITQLNGYLYGTGTRAKGSSSTANLSAAYPNSPLNAAMTAVDDGTNTAGLTLKEWYQKNVLEGTQVKNTLTGDVDMNYGDLGSHLAGAPNVAAITTDVDGEPVDPYVPDVSAGNADGGTYPESGHAGSLGSVASPYSTAQSKFDLTDIPLPGKSPVPPIVPSSSD